MEFYLDQKNLFLTIDTIDMSSVDEIILIDISQKNIL